MKGFFSGSSWLQSSVPIRLPQCDLCQLYKHCKSPKMPVSGKGQRKILLVGENPGEEEDKQGIQFIGPSGQVLKNALSRCDIDMRRDCWLTNAVICRAGEGKKNRKPDDDEIKYCRPNLTKAIKDLDPDVIIPLGAVAVKSVIGGLWEENPGGIEMWAGFQIPCQKPNSWICPTYHPAALEYAKNPVLDKFFEKHLRKAVNLEEKPWNVLPAYERRIEKVLEPSRAAKIIRGFIQEGGRASFDYETNMKKPDSDKAEIVCASICWEGKRTISFPFAGEVIPAMKEFLVSDLKKIGQSMKFEHRWSRAILGVEVKNWIYDDLLGMHWLDHRSGITGFAFQSFAILGQSNYWSHLEAYLQSDGGGNSINRVRDIDLPSLLLYCGLDSCLEYEVAIKQRAKVGWPL